MVYWLKLIESILSLNLKKKKSNKYSISGINGWNINIELNTQFKIITCTLSHISLWLRMEEGKNDSNPKPCPHMSGTTIVLSKTQSNPLPSIHSKARGRGHFFKKNFKRSFLILRLYFRLILKQAEIYGPWSFILVFNGIRTQDLQVYD